MSGPIPFQDLTRLHASIDEELRAALDATLARSSFIGGPDLIAFEEEFGHAVGARHVVGCNSGTDALALAMRALGIGPGDEVIVPSMTYVASAETVLHVGATLVLADVDPDTLLLRPEDVARVRTSRTRAVVPVHLYGNMVDPAALRQWRDEGLIVLEDCAQAHLAHREGVAVGSIGHAAAYSFFPGKNLGAMGDAGALTTEDPSVAAEVRRLRDHGRSSKYRHEILGYSSRLDGIQSAVLRVKLRHLPAWTEARRTLASRYRERLAEITPTIPLVPFGEGSVHHLLVVRVDEREQVQQRLEGAGVATGVHYPIALSDQPVFADLGASTPNAEAAADTVLSLPMDPLMSEAEVDRVCAALAGSAGRKAAGPTEP
jgi:dTDP-4-amino-4,6-dideoxygalactose transaminase